MFPVCLSAVRCPLSSSSLGERIAVPEVPTRRDGDDPSGTFRRLEDREGPTKDSSDGSAYAAN